MGISLWVIMKAIVSNSFKAIKDVVALLSRPACLPVSQRIDSARMSHTRLKAMQRPAPEQADFNTKLSQTGVCAENGLDETWHLLGESEETPSIKQLIGQGKRMAKRASDISQMRLAAYVAQLPEQEPDNQYNDACEQEPLAQI